MERAQQGLKISGYNQPKIVELLEGMLQAEGPERLTLLIRTLTEISKSEKQEAISSVNFRYTLAEKESDKINDIYNYSMANLSRKITLEEVAAVAGISPNSFCRFFKSRTRKTYSEFLNEIRVGRACMLLIDNQLNVKQVCFESGFNNFASFHKCFKHITGKSPLVYQKEFIKK